MVGLPRWSATAIVTSFHHIWSCHAIRVQRRASSVQVVLHPRNHFPSILPSTVTKSTTSLLLFQWQYVECFRRLICSKMTFSSSTPIFSQIHVSFPFCPANSEHPASYPNLEGCDCFFHCSSSLPSSPIHIVQYTISVFIQVLVSLSPCWRIWLSISLSDVDSLSVSRIQIFFCRTVAVHRRQRSQIFELVHCFQYLTIYYHMMGLIIVRIDNHHTSSRR